jgi:hypothetical protein
MSHGGGKPVIRSLKEPGSSSNMAIDGTTPVVFDVESFPSVDSMVHSFSILVEVVTVQFGNKFVDSTLGTLSNGVLLEGKFEDEPITFRNMKRTRDIAELATGCPPTAISGTRSLFFVCYEFHDPIFMRKQGTYAAHDFLRATVRDDLTILKHMEIILHGVKHS